MGNKENPSKYYEYYPKLFHPYFSDIDETKINQLSKAGFSFYQSLMQLDAVIDAKENFRIFNVLDLQENAVKILTSMYHEDSQFWSLWKTRKTEFREAISLEKNLWNNYSEENYNEVADKKSAFGKIAIDSLYVLTNNKNHEVYNALIKSHYYFSVAFQLFDDITDFKIDFEKGQFNKAVYELSKLIDFTKYNNDTNILNKLLYIEDVGVKILDESIYNLDKAKDCISFLTEKSLWSDTIDDFKQTIKGYKSTTHGYLQTLQERAKLKKNNYKRI